MLVYFLYSPSIPFQNQVQSWWSLFLPLTSIILIVFILDYYIDSISASRLDVFKTSRYGAYALFTSAVMLSYLWSDHGGHGAALLGKIDKEGSVEHEISGGVVFSGLLFIFGELLWVGKIQCNYEVCENV